MIYDVKYISKEGRTLQSKMEAENEIQLLSILKNLGFYHLSSKPVKPPSAGRGSMNEKIVSMFCYQLSTMLSSGISLLESLDLLQKKAKGEKEKKIYRGLYETVQKGNSLSGAMILQKGVFDQMLISMVQSGEKGGNLDNALKSMSIQYDKNKKIRDKIKTASLYPVILMTISLAVVLILVVFVLPGVTANFAQGEMPFATRILIGLSNLLIKYWILIIMALIVVVVIFKILYDTPNIKMKFHNKLLHLPVMGELVQTIFSARIARSFSSLYSQGVSTLDTIELTSGVLSNSYLEMRLKEAKKNVSSGMNLSTAIGEIEELDPMLSSMLLVGEETGSLDTVLNKIADYFDNEADLAINTLIGYIEPVMIVTMGITIGFIVISIIQPIFQMYESVG